MIANNNVSAVKNSVPAILATNTFFSLYALAVVPGYEWYLAGAAVLGGIAFVMFRAPSARIALVVTSGCSLGAGFFVRWTVGYQRHGWNSDVTFVTIVVFALLICAVAFIDQIETERRSGADDGE